VHRFKHIDLLMVCGGITREEAVRLKAQVLKAFDYCAPLELHVVTAAEFEGWYRRFIDRLEEVE